MSSPGAGLPQGRPQLKFFGKKTPKTRNFFRKKPQKPKKTRDQKKISGTRLEKIKKIYGGKIRS
jgi:hypothetical protein